MSKHHLAKVGVSPFSLLVQDGNADIFQSKPLDLRNPVLCHPQGDQGRTNLGDFMPQILCPGVAISGGAGFLIGKTARCQNHAIGEDVPPFFGKNPADFSILCQNIVHSVLNDFHIVLNQKISECLCDILALVGNGKDPVAPFYLERDPQFLEEVHGLLVGVTIKSTV